MRDGEGERESDQSTSTAAEDKLERIRGKIQNV